MFFPQTHTSAIILMLITMLCWGSWANTQKLCKNYPFELFYWDYAIGVFLTTILLALSLGTANNDNPSFMASFLTADFAHISSALIGGAIFNIANILLVAAIAIAGMAIAFPVAIGIALILGTALSYYVAPSGNALFLFSGILLVLFAIIIDALVYKKKTQANNTKQNRGLIISILSGVLMGTFYPEVAHSMQGLHSLDAYSANIYFAIGLMVCNLIISPLLLKFPLTGGKSLAIKQFFTADFKNHLFGIFGGLIWAFGMGFNLIAANESGPAIAYAFGQGATLIAAIWGVFIWREFKGLNVKPLLTMMFTSYVLGLSLIGFARII